MACGSDLSLGSFSSALARAGSTAETVAASDPVVRNRRRENNEASESSLSRTTHHYREAGLVHGVIRSRRRILTCCRVSSAPVAESGMKLLWMRLRADARATSKIARYVLSPPYCTSAWTAPLKILLSTLH